MLANKKLFERCATAVVGTALGLGAAIAFSAPASAAPSPGVCSGGSILSGAYTSLTIEGACAIDKGTVNVTGNVTIEPGDSLAADFGGSDLRVKGDVTVRSNALLVLGCAPSDFACENDPNPAHPTLATHHSIGGKLVASGARDVQVNNSSVKGNVTFTGADREFLCLIAETHLIGAHDLMPSLPGISAFEDNNFGGAVTIKDVHTCWMGFLRNQVVGTVTYNNNFSVELSGNEIVGNKIGGDLKCMGNDSAPHGTLAHGGPNLVAGVRTGQCRSTSLP